MKVLSVITQLEGGGAQTVQMDLHRSLLARGHNSKAVFLYEKDPQVFPERDFNLCFEGRPTSFSGYARIISEFRRMWKEFQPDVIFAHTHYAINICASIKASGASGKLIAVHHNLYSSYPKLSRLLDRVSRSAGLYDGEISCSKPVERSFPKKTKSQAEKHQTIANGQNLVTSDMSKLSARTFYGLPGSEFILGNVGRLAEQKNQQFLIELLPRLPKVHLAILGDGHLKELLVRRALELGVRDRLHMIGAVVRENVPIFLKSIDLFAMPSLHEGLSIAMLEAFSAGVPFIGNDIPSISEVIETDGEDKAGIVMPLSLDAWAGEISALLLDPAALQRLSALQVHQSKKYSIGTMVEGYIKIAETTLRRN